LKQLAIICALLLVPWSVVTALDGDTRWAGQFGLALVFAFTALGHFVKTNAMTEMLPPSIQGRRALILASGISELLVAMLLLALPKSRFLGLSIIGFLIRISGECVCGRPAYPLRRALRWTDLPAHSRSRSTSPHRLDILVRGKGGGLGAYASYGVREASSL
jgi:hypothetical protein